MSYFYCIKLSMTARIVAYKVSFQAMSHKKIFIIVKNHEARQF